MGSIRTHVHPVGVDHIIMSSKTSHQDLSFFSPPRKDSGKYIDVLLRFPSISKEVLIAGQCWHLERLWFVIHVVKNIVLKVVAVTFRWLSLTIIVERSNVKIPLALALATSNHPKCQPRWKIWHLWKVITDIAIVMTSMELWRYQTTTNWAQMVPVFLQVILFSTF